MNESVAALLLRAARADAKALQALSGLADISDAIVGFHAQQAVEKALKAVLSSHRIDFRRTHDIAELLDAITDHGVPAPPFSDSLDELNPYAVEVRYGLIGPGAFDRQRGIDWVDAVLEWAEAHTEAR